ncbi:MAG: cell division protein ZapA [Bacteroidetes bacterium]|nr:cell division protein ZapA [Bacteroidota bacterium]
METVKVKIMDLEFSLKGEDPDLIRKCAALVDRTMRELNTGRADRSPVALAVLTAINLAEELELLKRMQAEPESFYQTELTRMVGFTQDLLKG